MRLLIALPVILLAGCNVERDPANDSTTLEFNEAVAQNTVSDIANGAEEVASGAANVAGKAGDAIANEVGDVDVDVDVNRNKPADSQTNSN